MSGTLPNGIYSGYMVSRNAFGDSVPSEVFVFTVDSTAPPPPPPPPTGEGDWSINFSGNVGCYISVFPPRFAVPDIYGTATKDDGTLIFTFTYSAAARTFSIVVRKKSAAPSGCLLDLFA